MPLKGTIEIDELYCKGCELCVEACPQDVMAPGAGPPDRQGLPPGRLVAEGCTGCAVCALVCPEAAITVYREALRGPRGWYRRRSYGA